MKVASLFAGIGGFDLGLQRAGMSIATRYRMLGNAVTVPVAEWIGRRIIAAHGHGREDCNGENHI